jgi:hypothetical protein
MDREDTKIEGVILLQEEPLSSILSKWLAWIVVMVIFITSLIYFSNWFAKPHECSKYKYS